MKTGLVEKQSTSPILAPDAIPPELSPAQGIALAALLVGKTRTVAAREAGVCRTTLHNWMRTDPRFVAALNSLQAELVETAMANVRLMTGKAVEVLHKLMIRKDTPPAVKLQAAQTVLKLGLAPVEGPTDVKSAKIKIVDNIVAAKDNAAQVYRHRDVLTKHPELAYDED